MQVIIEGSQIKNIDQFHKYVKKAFELPDYYGENLDAFWDCITGHVELPVSIIWNDYSLSEENLGEYAEKIQLLLQEAEEELGSEINIIIKYN